jgi:hypothetical protein
VLAFVGVLERRKQITLRELVERRRMIGAKTPGKQCYKLFLARRCNLQGTISVEVAFRLPRALKREAQFRWSHHASCRYIVGPIEIRQNVFGRILDRRFRLPAFLPYCSREHLSRISRTLVTAHRIKGFYDISRLLPQFLDAPII